jgi:hypothetical protein
MNARALLATNTAIRTAYGLAAILAPNGLAKAAGVPEPEPDARYLNRLFGGRDLTVSALAFAALGAGDERTALRLIASCEATDLVGLVLEARRRGGLDKTLRAGIAFNAAGWLVLALAARDGS